MKVDVLFLLVLVLIGSCKTKNKNQLTSIKTVEHQVDLVSSSLGPLYPQEHLTIDNKQHASVIADYYQSQIYASSAWKNDNFIAFNDQNQKKNANFKAYDYEIRISNATLNQSYSVLMTIHPQMSLTAPALVRNFMAHSVEKNLNYNPYNFTFKNESYRADLTITSESFVPNSTYGQKIFPILKINPKEVGSVSSNSIAEFKILPLASRPYSFTLMYPGSVLVSLIDSEQGYGQAYGFSIYLGNEIIEAPENAIVIALPKGVAPIQYRNILQSQQLNYLIEQVNLLKSSLMFESNHIKDTVVSVYKVSESFIPIVSKLDKQNKTISGNETFRSGHRDKLIFGKVAQETYGLIMKEEYINDYMIYLEKGEKYLSTSAFFDHSPSETNNEGTIIAEKVLGSGSFKLIWYLDPQDRMRYKTHAEYLKNGKVGLIVQRAKNVVGNKNLPKFEEFGFGKPKFKVTESVLLSDGLLKSKFTGRTVFQFFSNKLFGTRWIAFLSFDQDSCYIKFEKQALFMYEPIGEEFEIKKPLSECALGDL